MQENPFKKLASFRISIASFDFVLSSTTVIILVIVIFLIPLSAYKLISRQIDVQKRPDPNVVATVNGAKIQRRDFESALNAQKYFYEKVYASETNEQVSDEFLQSLPKLVLDNLIQEKLLGKYLDDKGIRVTDDEVRQEIKTNVVDPTYNGDWQAYENSLKERYTTSLANIMRNFRQNLLITKVVEVENIKSEEFGRWYLDLRAGSEVSTYLNEQ